VPDSIDEEIDIVKRRVESFEKVMELPAEPPALQEIRRIVTIFRELRNGVTSDGKTKIKVPQRYAKYRRSHFCCKQWGWQWQVTLVMVA
jgi:hypothetical protein